MVGGGCGGGRRRRWTVAPLDAPAGADSRPHRRPQGGGRQPAIGAGHRGRFGGLVDRWCQSRPGEGARRDGRWGRQLGVPASRTRQRGTSAEHLRRLRRGVRWSVLERCDRRDVDPGGRPPGRTAPDKGAGRDDRCVQRVVRGLLRDRRLGLSRRLQGSGVQVRRLATAGGRRLRLARSRHRGAARRRPEAGIPAVRPG